MPDERSEQIELAVNELPPLSPSVSKILDLVNDLSASPKDLLDVVKLDPVLTGKILKLLNSAFYGLPNQVTNLNKALILLGFNTIKNLALSTAVLDTLSKKTATQFDTDALWDHCLATAVAAKMLARSVKVPAGEREEYFIAGLLHDIGRVVLVQYMPAEYESVMEQFREHGSNSEHLTTFEKQVLGMDHCAVGQILVEKWNLPANLRDVVTQHHTPSESRHVRLVHIASMYCKQTGLGLDIDGCHDIRPESLESESLSGQDLEGIFEALGEEIDKARVLLAN